MTEVPVHGHGTEVHPPSPQLGRAADLFRALGDPQRLRLLEVLVGGEVCVSELAERTGSGLPTVSQRLKTLRAAGLVAQRRDGKHIYYSLADHHVIDLVEAGLDHAGER